MELQILKLHKQVHETLNFQHYYYFIQQALS